MIILHCVKEKSKLRIKFHSYFDNEKDKKVYLNVYDNSYNCKFPKDIRKVGRFYTVDDSALKLYCDTATPFYMINKNSIKVYETQDDLNKELGVNTCVETIAKTDLKIFESCECVICFSEESAPVFIPCAHKCVCNDCYAGLKRTTNTCPLCRKNIMKVVIVDSSVKVEGDEEDC